MPVIPGEDPVRRGGYRQSVTLAHWPAEARALATNPRQSSSSVLGRSTAFCRLRAALRSALRPIGQRNQAPCECCSRRRMGQLFVFVVPHFWPQLLPPDITCPFPRPTESGPNRRRRRSVSASSFSVSHSHTRITRKPPCRRARIDRASRALFALNFSRQKISLVFGTVARLQARWWCQKQPLTNAANFLLRFARSGEPGRETTFRR